MAVVECDIPRTSVINRSVVDGAYFRDSYRAPLQRPEATVVDIFMSVFGHHPLWMKLALVTRNRIAAMCGLDAPNMSEIMNPKVKSSYRVGDKIGPWPIFVLEPNELVAGRNNKHLDFRLSIIKEPLKEPDGHPANTVISTICTVHNLSGKIYLFFIVPFHKWGVKKLIARAISAGRL
jgi:Protein of unknown function (DUF2867)